ncbi:MAG: YqcC family protein [Pseudomonadota bacterium]
MLIDVEAELRRLRLWDAEPPDAAALASVQPFAIDTLTLPQWLQFIFLPNMYRLIEDNEELPQRCGIVPMAEEFFRGTQLDLGGLLTALRQIDILLSDGQPDYGVDT